MTETGLQQVLLRGEDSRHQFKRDATNADGVAAELSAFANSGGGHVFIGVADDGRIVGLRILIIKATDSCPDAATNFYVKADSHS